MKPLTRALAIGCAIEAVAAGMFALGGFGPCGPSNLFGFIGMVAHFFPGLVVFEAVNAVAKIPDAIATITIVVAQALFWSAISFAVITFRQHRQ